MAGLDRRIGILFLAFVALLSIAVVRATYLGSFRASSLKRAAATQQVSNVVLPAPRGSITDRNGVELAISQAADDVVADPYLIKNPVKVSRQLAPLLGKTPMAVLELVTKPRTGFVYLAHLLMTSKCRNKSVLSGRRRSYRKHDLLQTAMRDAVKCA